MWLKWFISHQNHWLVTILKTIKKNQIFVIVIKLNITEVRPIEALPPAHQNCSSAARGVVRSAELNHVESACAERPNISPLTPHCPAHTQTKSLTHQPPPVPTFRCLWRAKSVPITDWTGWRLQKKQILCCLLMCGSDSTVENEKQLAWGSS